MVKIHPIPALSVDPARASEVTCVPYDIVSRAESRALAQNHPDTLLRVDRADLEFPDSVKFNAPEVYEKAAQNFARLIQNKSLLPEEKPTIYLVRMIEGKHRQRGFAALADFGDYASGQLRKHEFTRPDKEDDRVNLIRLNSAGLPGPAAARAALPSAPGRMVTLADLETWCSASALPTDLGTLLDQMRPILAQMGCPISPRVYRGICRFVASSLPIMSQEKAFELQMAQRIAPRIRSLITNRQIEALDALLKLLNQSTVCAFEESLSLLEDIRQSLSGRQWELEP